MPLHRLVYVSDAVGAAGANLMSVVDILGVSDRNNRRDHLSGVLLFHNGRFLQAIEGARSDLDRLMARLGRDTRHRNIRILSDRPIAERAFSGWTMGQVEVTPNLADILGGAALETLTGPQAETLLCEAAGVPLAA